MRFQQFTGPAMAKGVEDTVFYNFNRLISLNEVGGDPGRFGVSPRQFHAYCSQTQRTHPRTMLASSTHDTKRSEDVRARINLLSEIPALWEKTLLRWKELNAGFKANEQPDFNTEYFLYQTWIGAWPIEEERLSAYMEKVVREAKAQTSWLTPDQDFEKALRNFISALYGSQEFQQELRAFVEPLVEPGRINSLSQLLLKLTAPGIPDMYQGSELWDLSLVDPDNRRPVDYELRRKLLLELPNLTVDEIMKRSDEGLPKLLVMNATLDLRNRNMARFATNTVYHPIQASGSKAANLFGIRRGRDLVVLAPRLVMKLGGDWGDTNVKIPEGAWTNIFTRERVAAGTRHLSEVFRQFPVALLARD